MTTRNATITSVFTESLMAVALPVLMTDLGVSPNVGQWLTAGFLLTMAVIIPITGFLIRRVPTRALYGTAMGLFIPMVKMPERIALSVALILFVILAIYMGWITPHDIGRAPPH